MLESDKIMFEIYKEGAYGDRYRVVYFTELEDHDKDKEIDRAFAGEHFYDGFIRGDRNEKAKGIIEDLLERLNEGEEIAENEVDCILAKYMP